MILDHIEVHNIQVYRDHGCVMFEVNAASPMCGQLLDIIQDTRGYPISYFPIVCDLEVTHEPDNTYTHIWGCKLNQEFFMFDSDFQDELISTGGIMVDYIGDGQWGVMVYDTCVLAPCYHPDILLSGPVSQLSGLINTAMDMAFDEAVPYYISYLAHFLAEDD